MEHAIYRDFSGSIIFNQDLIPIDMKNKFLNFVHYEKLPMFSVIALLLVSHVSFVCGVDNWLGCMPELVTTPLSALAYVSLAYSILFFFEPRFNLFNIEFLNIRKIFYELFFIFFVVNFSVSVFVDSILFFKQGVVTSVFDTISMLDTFITGLALVFYFFIILLVYSQRDFKNNNSKTEQSIVDIIDLSNTKFNFVLYFLTIASVILTIYADKFILSQKWTELENDAGLYFLLLTATHIVNLYLLLIARKYNRKTITSNFGIKTEKFFWKLSVTNAALLAILSYVVWQAKFINTSDMDLFSYAGLFATAILAPLQGLYYLKRASSLLLDRFKNKDNTIDFGVVFSMFVFALVSLSCLQYVIWEFSNILCSGCDFM